VTTRRSPCRRTRLLVLLPVGLAALGLAALGPVLGVAGAARAAGTLEWVRPAVGFATRTVEFKVTVAGGGLCNVEADLRIPSSAPRRRPADRGDPDQQRVRGEQGLHRADRLQRLLRGAVRPPGLRDAVLLRPGLRREQLQHRAGQPRLRRGRRQGAGVLPRRRRDRRLHDVFGGDGGDLTHLDRPGRRVRRATRAARLLRPRGAGALWLRRRARPAGRDDRTTSSTASRRTTSAPRATSRPAPARRRSPRPSRRPAWRSSSG